MQNVDILLHLSDYLDTSQISAFSQASHLHNSVYIPDVILKKAYGSRSFVDLAADGDLRGMKYLLSKKKKQPYKKALTKACMNGRTSVVKFILSKKIDFHFRREEPFRKAVEYDRLDIMEILLVKGVDVNINGGWALKKTEDPFVIKMLLDYGAIDSDGTIMKRCIRLSEYLKMMIILNTDVPFSLSYRPFHSKRRHHSFSVTKDLIIDAILNDDVHMFTILIENAPFSMKPYVDECMGLIAYKNRQKLVALLLRSGVPFYHFGVGDLLARILD